MEQRGESARTLAKQFAIGVGISALLPLAVWYGVRLYDPPPDWEVYIGSDLSEDRREAKGEEKSQLHAERTQRKQEREEAQRLFYRDLLYVAYPVGILALLLGAFLRVQAVGAGLMFGGLYTRGRAATVIGIRWET